MEYAFILVILIFIFVIPALYVHWDFSLKKQIIIDVCILSSMLMITFLFKTPVNLLVASLVFFGWTLVGNIFKYIYPLFWEWVENQYFKKNGIPVNKKKSRYRDESGNAFICKLIYFTIETTLIILFIRSIVLNLL